MRPGPETSRGDALWRRIDPLTVVCIALGTVYLALFQYGSLFDDEGHLNYVGARLQMLYPAEMLATLKFRPAYSLLYGPFAMLGWNAYRLWHIFLSTAALYVMGLAVSKSGGRGWLTSLVAGGSIVYAVAAVTGQGNCAAFLFFGLIHLLLVTERAPALAGVLSGMLPLVRYEFAPYTLGFTLMALYRPARWRFFGGLAAFCASFWGYGAWHHWDMLWFAHYPPTLPMDFPGSHNRDYIKADRQFIATLLDHLLMVTPLWSVALLPLASLLPRRDRPMVWAFWLTVLLLVGFPIAGIWGFDHNPRYWLAFLSPIGVLAGMVRISSLPRAGRWPAIWITIALAFGLGAAFEPLSHLFDLWCLSLIFFAGIHVLRMRAGGIRERSYAVAAVVIAAAPLFTSFVSWEPVAKAFVRRECREIATFLLENPPPARYRKLWTNENKVFNPSILETITPRFEVRYLAQYDMLLEAYLTLDRRNGDYATIMNGLRHQYYTGVLFPCDLVEVEDFNTVVFIIRDDYRLDSMYSERYLNQISRAIHKIGPVTLRMGRARRADASGVETLALSEPYLTAPCGQPNADISQAATR